VLVPHCVSSSRQSASLVGSGQLGKVVLSRSTDAGRSLSSEEVARFGGGEGKVSSGGSFLDSLFSPHVSLPPQVSRATAAVRHWWSREGKGASASERDRPDQCVVAADAVQSLGLSHIDFLSLDVEGFEAEVLRCWPFERLPVHAILVETGRYRMAEVDRFFHNHGFANVQTFITNIATRPSQQAVYTDNLFVRRARPARLPAHVLGVDHKASSDGDHKVSSGNASTGTVHEKLRTSRGAIGMTAEESAAAAFKCGGMSKYHRTWFCARFFRWDPPSELWGECPTRT
jgi:hypothetical protein